MAKAIAYKDMSAAQKVKAEKWAMKWGTIPEKCKMTRGGLIITHRQDFPNLSDVDYNLIREGVHYADITDAMRADYIESLKDVPSAEEMEHVKATFTATRG